MKLLNKFLEYINDSCWHKWELIAQANILDANNKVVNRFCKYRCAKCFETKTVTE